MELSPFVDILRQNKMGEEGTQIPCSKFPRIIELNVGGVKYSTTLLTLTKRCDTMLAAMFGGKFDVQKDKDGRYFIDADGEMFSHILRYLRYDEIPPYSLCEKVYKDACYFGLNDLVEQLENMPPLIGKKMKQKFHSRIEGYEGFVNDVIKQASKIDHLGFSSALSSVTIILFQHQNVPELSNFDVNHQCFQKATTYLDKDVKRIPKVYFGPWSMDLGESDIMKILINDLEERKFVCNYQTYGQCHYKCDIPRELRLSYGGEKSILCHKLVFVVNFHWSKM